MTDPAVDALWKKALDAWDDDARHGAFIEYCQATGQLLEAAVRYRGMAGDHARGPSAQKRLGGIAVLALAALETARAPERSSLANFTKVAAILLFLAGSAALLFALNRR
jgi:hypothetical protein